jgi:hypothetical protein
MPQIKFSVFPVFPPDVVSGSAVVAFDRRRRVVASHCGALQWFRAVSGSGPGSHPLPRRRHRDFPQFPLAKFMLPFCAGRTGSRLAGEE